MTPLLLKRTLLSMYFLVLIAVAHKVIGRFIKIHGGLVSKIMQLNDMNTEAMKKNYLSKFNIFTVRIG